MADLQFTLNSTGVGADYSLPSEFCADSRDLATPGDTATLTAIEAFAPNDYWDCSAWTCSQANSVTFTAAPGIEYDPITDTGFKFQCTLTSGSALNGAVYLSQPGEKIEKIGSFHDSRRGFYAAALSINGLEFYQLNKVYGQGVLHGGYFLRYAYHRLSNSIFVGDAVGVYLDRRSTAGGEAVAGNCVFEGGTSWGINSTGGAGATQCYFDMYNCSVLSAGGEAWNRSSNFVGVYENCGFEDIEAPATATNSALNLTRATGVDFVDTVAMNYNPTPSGKLKDLGSSVGLWYTDDYTGYERGSDPWDSSAYEIQGSLPGVELETNPINQEQSLSTVAVSIVTSVNLDGASQQQSLDAVIITQAGQLQIDSIDQIQNLSQLGITQAHLVSPSNINQNQTLDPVSLLVAGLINLEGIGQDQSLTSPAITQAYPELQIAPLSQLQVIRDASISQSVQLIVEAINQRQTMPPLPLTAANILYLLGIEQDQELSKVDASQAYLLRLDDLNQEQIVSSLRLGSLIVAHLEGKLCIIKALEGELSIN